uniref:Zgc:163014 n=1 Tax=Poecilia formosa TaxID=48698 RepID=A0A096LXW6_POEFO
NSSSTLDKILDKYFIQCINSEKKVRILRLKSDKSNRSRFQVHIPLPLPKQLVIFGFGDWSCKYATLSAEVVVSEDVQPQNIGTLSPQIKCLTWEGDWSDDIITVAEERGRKGVYEFQSLINGFVTQFKFPPQKVEVVKFAENNKTNNAVWLISPAQYKKLLKLKRPGVNLVLIHSLIFHQISACPSKRWSHAMCLSDPDTAVLIGGEPSDQNYCEDSLWKLELDSDFWFPMTSSASGPVPPCARGHTATFDPDSKAVFVYGGLRESQRYSELYILNTLTWKWRLVTAKGKVPALSYHSAVFYQKELFVFGGVQPINGLGDKCSNALYIFSPEYELWYQPIVEGDKPLPRFGHSATLLGRKLVIFGGQMTAAYLNDLHVLDLGLMEYTAVKSANMPPLPRGFHAAAPVLDNRILISGGCSAIGALQDVHVFNTDTSMWSSVACPLLCSKPRAGHSMINLQTEQVENRNIKCTLLVFGGSDCSGSFYNDTQKFCLEITDKMP